MKASVRAAVAEAVAATDPDRPPAERITADAERITADAERITADAERITADAERIARSIPDKHLKASALAAVAKAMAAVGPDAPA